MRLLLLLLLHFSFIVHHHIRLLLLLWLLRLLNWGVGVALRVKHQNRSGLILLLFLLLLMVPGVRGLLLLLNDHLLILSRSSSFLIVVLGRCLLLYNSQMIRLSGIACCCRHIYLWVLALRGCCVRDNSYFIQALISLISWLVRISCRNNLCGLLGIPIYKLLMLGLLSVTRCSIDCCRLL